MNADTRTPGATSGAWLGCDIGGTFTDFVLFDTAAGRPAIHIDKRLTTPDDPSAAVMEGVGILERIVPGFVPRIEGLIHGTTLVINALIERKGATTALVTTRGFSDALEIGRELRYDVYDLFLEFPEPLVPRPLRHGIAERIAWDGSVLEPVDEADVRRVADRLLEQSVRSVAVCLLHSYTNPAHEQRVRELITARAPGLHCSISSEVLPEIREYERTLTTVINAYVQPIYAGYVERLEGQLREAGLRSRLLIMLSGGGVASTETAVRLPVRMIESGPVAGVIAAARLARETGIMDALAFDMGGTTAKSCAIVQGEPAMTREMEIARVHRFKQGSGMTLRVPAADIMEIGAGGGSTAEVNQYGLIQVGPRSAGAVPGPACYARGGEEPTVTDADLVLGYLDADHFLGGRMKLDAAAARAALRSRIADRVGMTVDEAAVGVHDIVNETMAHAARVYLAERGIDPGRLTLVAFGGAGPVHAAGLAAKLGMRRVVVPPAAGVFSALGFLVAPRRFDALRSHKVMLKALDPARLAEILAALEREVRDVLAQAGVPSGSPLHLKASVDMRYVGQGFEVSVPVESHALGEEVLRKEFEAAYGGLYGRIYPDVEIELVTARLSGEAPVRFTLADLARVVLETRHAGGRADTQARRPARAAYCFRQRAFIEHAVYDRYRLSATSTVAGPAIVEEIESTTVVPRDWSARVDDGGNLVLEAAG